MKSVTKGDRWKIETAGELIVLDVQNQAGPFGVIVTTVSWRWYGGAKRQDSSMTEFQKLIEQAKLISKK